MNNASYFFLNVLGDEFNHSKLQARISQTLTLKRSNFDRNTGYESEEIGLLIVSGR